MAITLKSATVNVRTTDVRKKLYRAQAESEGMRLAEWLRRLADRRLAEGLRLSQDTVDA